MELKKYFLFSDVHGEFPALKQGLIKSGFDPKDPNHILVSLGDLFDKGENNLDIFLFLTSFPKERVLMIKGNHDMMLLDLITLKDMSKFYHTISTNNMWPTVREFAGLPKNTLLQDVIDELPNIVANIIKAYPELNDFLESMHDRIILKQSNYTFILTHGGFSRTSKTRTIWETDNLSYTPSFIEQTKGTPDLIYIFGHFRAFELAHIFDVPLSPEGIFYYQNKHNIIFIGIDGASNLNKKIPILIINSSIAPILN